VKYLSDYVRQEYSPAKNFLGESSQQSKKKQQQQAGQQQQQPQNNIRPPRRQQGESAASANSQGGADKGERGAVQQRPNAAAPQGGKSKDSMKKAVGPFSKEITRSDWLYCDGEDGRRHLYTATNQKCPNCAGDKKHSFPVCFLAQCKVCSMYGHKTADCKQNKVVGHSAIVIVEHDDIDEAEEAEYEAVVGDDEDDDEVA
jgi:hypothetical protein